MIGEIEQSKDHIKFVKLNSAGWIAMYVKVNDEWIFHSINKGD